MYKTLSSEYLFKDLWFTVRKDSYQTPSGKIVSPYYVYEFPEWVTALAITEENKIVFVKQYRHGLGEEGLELPGGCVDKTDKDYTAAIARELLEETGYEFSSYEYLGKISSNPSTNSNLMHMFLAQGGKKIAGQNLDANEEIEVLEFSTDEVKQLVKENKIIQSMHLATIFYAFQKLGLISW